MNDILILLESQTISSCDHVFVEPNHFFPLHLGEIPRHDWALGSHTLTLKPTADMGLAAPLPQSTNLAADRAIGNLT
jgi:hypothetical protein